MWFRRQAGDNAHSVAVARVGDAVHAVGIGPGADRPCLLWQACFPAVELPDALRQLQRRRRLVGTLVGLLGRTDYRLVSTELPDLPREEWRDAIRWRLKDLVDFPVDDAVVDVLEVPQEAAGRSSRSAIAFMTPGQAPRDLALLADDLGLAWSAVEAPETALRNLSAFAEEPPKAHALMAFGRDHALLVITLRGELLMTRTIEVSVAALSPTDEARGGALGRAGLEVLRTLDTFERTHHAVSLSGLSVVLPEGTEGMLEVLADLVYVPVKAYDLGARLDLSALGDDAAAMASLRTLEGLSVIGAALRPHSQAAGHQQINLRDASVTLDGVAWGAGWGARAVAATVVLATAATVGMSWWTRLLSERAQQLEADLGPLRASTQGLPKLDGLDELNALRDTESRQRRLRETLGSLTGQKAYGHAEYLMALGRQAQDGVWITGLSVRDDGRDLALSGRMTDPAMLPGYLARLQGEDRFKGRRFAQLEMRAVEDEPGVPLGITEFTLRSTEQARADGAAKGQP